MHEVELHPWHTQASHPGLWDGGLGRADTVDTLTRWLERPGGESQLRAAVEPELGTGCDLSDASILGSTLDLLEQGRVVMTESLDASLAVDPHYPVGDGSEDLGNLIDLMGEDRTEEEPERPTWIEIAVIDANGEPITGRPYRLRLPDGSVRKGTLDARGMIRFDDVDPGDCTLELLDESSESPESIEPLPMAA